MASGSQTRCDTSSLDRQPGLRVQKGGEPQHVLGRNGDASSRRRIAGFGDVEKDRAAAMASTAGDVPVENDDEVIETIVPHHGFGAGGERKVHRAVIGGGRRSVAPSVAWPGLADWERRTRPGHPIAPMPRGQEMKTCNRRCAVPFALEDRRPGPAQGARQSKRAGRENSAPLVERRAPHDDLERRFFLHLRPIPA